jgi:hypothetical protein
MQKMQNIPKIVSGGQTGADRAALDWALSHKLPCGDWCPKGRNGAIEAKYPLKESPSASYLQRTEWNVRDSDATVLFSLTSELTGGSKKTVEFARKHQKPWIHLAVGDQDVAQRLKDWLAQNAVDVLNVAGPRASKEPGIASFVILTLDAVFRILASTLISSINTFCRGGHKVLWCGCRLGRLSGSANGYQTGIGGQWVPNDSNCR